MTGVMPNAYGPCLATMVAISPSLPNKWNLNSMMPSTTWYACAFTYSSSEDRAKSPQGYLITSILCQYHRPQGICMEWCRSGWKSGKKHCVSSSSMTASPIAVIHDCVDLPIGLFPGALSFCLSSEHRAGVLVGSPINFLAFNRAISDAFAQTFVLSWQLWRPTYLTSLRAGVVIHGGICRTTGKLTWGLTTQVGVGQRQLYYP